MVFFSYILGFLFLFSSVGVLNEATAKKLTKLEAGSDYDSSLNECVNDGPDSAYGCTPGSGMNTYRKKHFSGSDHAESAYRREKVIMKCQALKSVNDCPKRVKALSEEEVENVASGVISIDDVITIAHPNPHDPIKWVDTGTGQASQTNALNLQTAFEEAKTAFEEAKTAFKEAENSCIESLKDKHETANSCCSDSPTSCSTVDWISLADTTANIAVAAANGQALQATVALSCALVGDKAKKELKAVYTIVKSCKNSSGSIQSKCETIPKRIDELKVAANALDDAVQPESPTINLSNPTNLDPQVASGDASKEAKELVTGFKVKTEGYANVNFEGNTVSTPVWENALAKQQKKYTEAAAQIATLAKETSTCSSLLSTASTVDTLLKKFNNKPNEKITPPAPVVIPPNPGLIGDNGGELEGGLDSNRDIVNDDDLDFNNEAGPNANNDASNRKDKGSGNTPGYANAAGLSGGGGGAGGSSRKKPGVAGGPSSLLQGFSNKKYSGGRVGMKSGSYTAKRYAYAPSLKKKTKKGRAFNLKAFLPGGKKDPNRQFASIGGTGVNIFSVISSKFQSSCVTEKLLDCK